MTQSKSKIYQIGKGLVIIIVSLAVIAALLHVINADWIERYLVLRVPLLAGIFLFTLPVIAFYMLPSLLENMFVLENPLRLTVVIIQAAVTGLGIVFVWLVIDSNACRFLNETCVNAPASLDANSIIPYLWGIFLAMPVAYASWAMADISNKKQKLLGAACGAAAVLALYSAIYYLRLNDSQSVLNTVAQVLKWLLNKVLPISQQAGFINPNTGKLAAGHLLALSFMLITVAIYTGCYFLYRPLPTPRKWQAPALYYFLVLIVPLTFVLGWLTFFLDYYRVPTLIIALLVSWAMFSIFDTDHFFKLIPSSKKSGTTVHEALKNRLAINNDGTLVVVCASGGGIQAAGWAAKVLIELQRLLGQSFANAIGLISSVSGGSVGAMHYLDSMNSVSNPDDKQLDKIFDNATTNSLDATGWGLAYPDLWRMMGAPFLPSKMNDRGEALENSWKVVMHSPDATFNSWQASMAEGSLPIAVFNSTQVEYGRRLLLSPISFAKNNEHSDIDFDALYKNYDIEVTTAARLSATFAYISPIARDNFDVQDFHAADGGYFDNYGVFTANQWLTDHVLSNVDMLGIKRIIYIEIRAFSAEAELQQSADMTDSTANQSRSGWVMALLGPLLTLANVRNTTQTARNEYDVDIMAECQSNGVEFYPYTFEFPKQIAFFENKKPAMVTKTPAVVAKVADKLATKKYTPPLSWKLSEKQKKAICEGWRQLEKNPATVSYQDLQGLLKIWGKQ